MNVRNRSSSRSKGQVVLRAVFGLGMVAALALAYSLSEVNLLEAIVLPAIVLGAVTFWVVLYSRARYRKEWSAAWDAYARREGVGETRQAAQVDRKFSMVNTH
jgi:hypothetical protein